MELNSAIFILCHGKPNSIPTLDLLHRIGYTGKLYIVLDNLDITSSEYEHNHIKNVTDILIFDKNYYIGITDALTNKPIISCDIFARNAIEDFAKNLNLDTFVMADDDILGFRFRQYDIESSKSYARKIESKFDAVLDAYYQAVIDMNLAYTGFPYQMQYVDKKIFINPIHKLNYAYNFMIRNAKIPIKWRSCAQGDFVTPTFYSNLGIYCNSLPFVSIDNSDQNNSYDLYRYIIVNNPTSLSIVKNGDRLKFLHHRRMPVLISSSYSKSIGD